MRSERPFFEDELTGEIITTTAEVEGRLLLYCGAGVTIDRTGHSWGGLVMSLLPERRHKSRPGMPTRSQVGSLNRTAPDTLASSVVYLLREASGGERSFSEHSATACAPPFTRPKADGRRGPW